MLGDFTGKAGKVIGAAAPHVSALATIAGQVTGNQTLTEKLVTNFIKSPSNYIRLMPDKINEINLDDYNKHSISELLGSAKRIIQSEDYCNLRIALSEREKNIFIN
jgi:hypothetical protein